MIISTMARHARISQMGIIVLLPSFIMIACSTITIKVDPTVDIIPVYEKTPLTLGLYTSPEFKTFEYTDKTEGVNHHFVIGEANQALLHKIVASMFSSFLPVNKRNGKFQLDAGVSGVLEAEVFSVQTTGENMDIKIIYRFTFYDNDGSLIQKWKIKGFGSTFYIAKYEPFDLNYMSRRTEWAILNAYGQFMQQFYQSSEINDWRSRHELDSNE